MDYLHMLGIGCTDNTQTIVRSELLTVGINISLRRSVKKSRFPKMPDNAPIMLLSCAILKIDY